MEAIVTKVIPLLITVILLAVIWVLMMGVGWASGKLIRKFFGIGGK
jgi:hypothetical protein